MNIQRSLMTTLLACCVILISSSSAEAWLRSRVEDYQLVARSQLIVVGHLESKFVHYTPNPVDLEGGHSGEYHATLKITKVIKGQCVLKQLPIIIFYGLTPCINGHPIRQNRILGAEKTSQIQIYDTGGLNGDSSISKIDASADAVWFLRQRAGVYGRHPGKGDYGIVDPEDLQPPNLQHYFQCYLSKHPVAALRKLMLADPRMAGRTMRYMQFQSVNRTARISDPRKRVERLIPYFLGGRTWGVSGLALRDIAAAGPIAAPYLMGIYQASRDDQIKNDIIGAWGNMRWQGAVATVIAELQQSHKFWANQQRWANLKAGWWNGGGNDYLITARQDEYETLCDTLWALRKIGDPKATAAVKQTMRQWEAIPKPRGQITRACQHALKAFAAAKP